MSERARTSDVAVLGAGVLGLLVARALARRKLSPLVLARRGPQHGLRRGAFASIWDHADPVPIARAGLESVERLQQLEGQIGPIGYAAVGGLAPAWTDADAADARSAAEARAAAGLPVEWVSREQALELEPALNPDVRGAAHSAREAVVDPSLLVWRLAAAAREQGAVLMYHAGYPSIAHRGGRYVIRGRDGDVEVKKLVVTSGDWADAVASGLGRVLPVRIVHRHAAVTERVPALLRHRIGPLRQQPDGTVVIDAGTADGPDELPLSSIAGAAADAMWAVPALAPVNMVGAWSWLATVSANGAPLVGDLGDGLYVAAPHAPGLTLVPLLAHALTLSVVEGRLPEAAAAWSANGEPETAGGRQDSRNGP